MSFSNCGTLRESSSVLEPRWLLRLCQECLTVGYDWEGGWGTHQDYIQYTKNVYFGSCISILEKFEDLMLNLIFVLHSMD